MRLAFVPTIMQDVGRMVVTDKADFTSKVLASMRSLQKNPEKIRAFYQKPSLRYAA